MDRVFEYNFAKMMKIVRDDVPEDEVRDILSVIRATGFIEGWESKPDK